MRFLKSFFTLLVLSAGTLASAQVVINEIGVISDPGPDDTEFIELFGPGNTSLNAYEIVLVNSSDGLVYRTIDLAGQTIPADGYFVVSWDPSRIPNTDLALPTATDMIQNGDPDAIVLRQKSDQSAIDAVTYFSLFNTTPGSGSLGSLPTWAYEGSPTGAGGDNSFTVQSGAAATGAIRLNASIGRFPNGKDSNDNYDDFIVFYKSSIATTLAGTPGEINNAGMNITLPFSETFTVGLTREWVRTYTDFLLETPSSANPASIPPSPDSVSSESWASVKDESGGGDEIILADFAATDYYMEAYFYCGSISTDQEFGTFGGRVAHTQNNNNTGAAPLDPSDYSTLMPYAPYSYRMIIDYLSGTVEAAKFDKDIFTLVGATAAPLEDGWHKLAMNFSGPTVTYYVDDEKIGELTSEPVRAGYIQVGYRETAASLGLIRNNFDGLTVRAAQTSKVTDWSVF